jgi:antitoxin ParD1/3/4
MFAVKNSMNRKDALLPAAEMIGGSPANPRSLNSCCRFVLISTVTLPLVVRVRIITSFMKRSEYPQVSNAKALPVAELFLAAEVPPSFLDSLWRLRYRLSMAMASLNISLPQALKDYVEDQVSTGGYSTPSEYLRELLRQDQKQRAERKLEALLLEGLNSGEPIEITPEYWERKRAQLVERHKKKTGTR